MSALTLYITGRGADGLWTASADIEDGRVVRADGRLGRFAGRPVRDLVSWVAAERCKLAFSRHDKVEA